jgi:cytochrome oxidase Cu insertion factor (SCO1/SenC/PrrC family)
MKIRIIYLFALVLILSLLMAACSGATSTAQTEEPKSAEIGVTEELNTTSPRTGDLAPDFTLPDSNGKMVHLTEELNDNQLVILVFYHEYT